MFEVKVFKDAAKTELYMVHEYPTKDAAEKAIPGIYKLGYYPERCYK